MLSFRLLLLAVAAAAAVIEKRTTQKAIEQAQQGSGVATSESTSEREIVNEVQSSGCGPAAEADEPHHWSGPCSAGSCAQRAARRAK